VLIAVYYLFPSYPLTLKSTRDMIEKVNISQALNSLSVKTNADFFYGEESSVPVKIKKSDLVEVIRAAMPVATLTNKGLADRSQGKIDYRLGKGESMEITLPDYGIYLLVSITTNGTSMLFQKAYNVKDLIIISDPDNIQGKFFNIEQISDGSQTIRVTNLNQIDRSFTLNRL
jgi:hypothetical protein